MYAIKIIIFKIHFSICCRKMVLSSVRFFLLSQNTIYAFFCCCLKFFTKCQFKIGDSANTKYLRVWCVFVEYVRSPYKNTHTLTPSHNTYPQCNTQKKKKTPTDRPHHSRKKVWDTFSFFVFSYTHGVSESLASMLTTSPPP